MDGFLDELFEARAFDRYLVIADGHIGKNIAARGIGLDRARNVAALVGCGDAGIGHGRAGRIVDDALNGAGAHALSGQQWRASA